MKYVFVYITPLFVFLSLYLGGIWSYLSLAVAFVIIPLLELVFTGNDKNLTKIEEDIAKEDPFYDILIYSLVPVQVALLVYFLVRVSDPSLPMWQKIGMMFSYGISCGSLGINAAHELGHRSTWYEQLMSKILLSTSLYMHFFIEHNRGHHKNVSTDSDPSSGRYGENVYAFYLRTITGTWLSAWHLENESLKKKNYPFWSWHNEMLWFQIIQIAIVATIGSWLGVQVLLLFLGGALLGILLLETVNYIEHYGLRRRKIREGLYERTMPIHSWNSDHTLGRLLLLELTRHSDHHYLASRKYQILRHFDESPQMPTGYPGMMLLSLIPPLWFKVMHRQIARYKATEYGAALA